MTSHPENIFYTSAEVRWFCEGPLPSFVREWFQSDFQFEEPSRTDVYLMFNRSAQAGVKFRGTTNDFEIKTKIADHGIRQFPGLGTGKIETWEKWHLNAPAVRPFKEASLTQKQHWVTTAKDRHGQKVCTQRSHHTGSRRENVISIGRL